jgi:hypothetical protein
MLPRSGSHTALLAPLLSKRRIPLCAENTDIPHIPHITDKGGNIEEGALDLDYLVADETGQQSSYQPILQRGPLISLIPECARILLTILTVR